MGSELSCKERTEMVLCPCLQFKNPRLLSIDCCTCCHEKRSETLNIPVLIKMAGIWLAPENPVNLWFLSIRIFLMLFVLYCATFTLVLYATEGHLWAFFIYLSHWNVIITCISFILNVLATVVVYRMRSKQSWDVPQNNLFSTAETLYSQAIPMYRIYVLQEIFLQIAVPANIISFVQYWTMTSDPNSWSSR